MYHFWMEYFLLELQECNLTQCNFTIDVTYLFLGFQIADKLAPFKKLYDNASQFLKKHYLWTSSKVGSFDPEEIEMETSQFYRNIYKLEKQFGDLQEPRRLAMTVSFFQ